MPLNLKNSSFITSLLLFLLGSFLYAQEPVKKDSTSIYKNIQNFSQKKKTTSFIHRLVFKPIKPKAPQHNTAPFDYLPFQGKNIHSITIITLDPFGNKIQDTTSLIAPENLKYAENWGNKLHLKSKDYTIRKVLLFKENEALDSITIKESVRLIRSQRFINRVDVAVTVRPELTNSVDVILTVLDSWSLVPNGSFSANQTTIKLKERNFLGHGHEIRGEYTNNNDGENGHFLQYTIPNFRKSFVKIQATHQESIDQNSFKNIDISRPFFSPLTKWAGGISYEEHFKHDTLANKNGVFSKQNFDYDTSDLWLGHAFSLENGASEKSKITKLILAARYVNLQFNESPLAVYDTLNFYSNQKVMLVSVGLNARKFIQERFLFNNGIIEDVPIGKAYSFTTGYQRKNHKDQLYLGTRASFGNYYPWGFFSMNAEWGTFFDTKKTSQTAFTFQANYFTKLYELGDWKIRQFLKQQVVLGSNRLASNGDQITINGDYGIQGFNNALYGTKKMVFSAQTQCYSPWDVWGFRLNPFLNYTIAVIGSPKSSNQKNSAFSSIGLGFIINNDYLVFSSFQLSFAYYPNVFDANDRNIIFNAFETSDFGLLDFELNKPRTVIYK